MSTPPVSRVPNEVLSEIFGLVKAEAPSYSPPPFLLGSVCSHWRNVVQNTPRLWTKIYITGSRRLPAHVGSGRNYPAILHEYFSHIGSLGLDVIIPRPDNRQNSGVAPWKPYSPHIAHQVMSILLDDHHHQIRSFRAGSLNRVSYEALASHASLPGRSFAMLEAVDIHFPGFGTNITDTNPHAFDPDNIILSSPTNLFPNAPHLRIFNVSTFKHYRHIPVTMPWDQLQVVDLRGTGPEQAIAMLSICPNITDFTFAYQDYGRQPFDMTHMVRHSRVQRFCWRLGTRDVHRIDKDTHLFTHVDLPGVQELAWGSWIPSDDECNWRPFFRRMTNVRKLICEYPGTHNVSRIWPLFNNVRELRLYENDFPEYSPVHRLYDLTVKAGHEALFPQLTTLHIELKRGTPYIVICLARLVHSRRNYRVHWINPDDETENVELLPNVPLSDHWTIHARLEEFSVKFTMHHPENVDFEPLQDLMVGTRAYHEYSKELWLKW
ncbi:hypothetical protein NP233_g2390 [Leucocoprinus birnbaumii]|uniref:F-box domain-containing protein n=1 Tax=Leucocoprinus birnbaumii TaxID=56174 RepID=A0AAD5W0D6_9AGAR|nr:hypothetical protein NP233_g2390 [Leucocoprinus birnbaumii]